MKRKLLSSSLLIFSLLISNPIGIAATENSTSTKFSTDIDSEILSSTTEESTKKDSVTPISDITNTSDSLENNIPDTQIIGDDKIEEFYEYAISTGKIKRELYSLEDFIYNYKIYLDEYPETKEIFKLEESFDEWFEQIRFGALPDGQGEAYSGNYITDISTRGFSDAQKRSANRFKKDLRKGDIIVVNSKGPGHAAIATTDNYILEMTGGRNPVKWFAGGIEKNNHQFNANNWLFGYSEQGWTPDQNINYKIQIWRIPNKNMDNQVANYADKHYFSYSGSYSRNINLRYLISPGPLVTNPNYCSKLVFNSYWYGSSNSPVIKDYYAHVQYIYPSALPDIFQNGYTPRKIGDY